MNINRGSEWRKWDLHFHTPSSYDYKDGSVTDEHIINTLSQNGISVVAVTDHHTIDIDRIKNLIRLGNQKMITILPGIEFLGDARGSEPIHFIAIFPNDCNLEHIWGQLKNCTDIKRMSSETKAANEVYCDLPETVKLIRELGGITSIHAGSKSNTIENITNSIDHSVAQKQDIAASIDIFEMGKEDDCAGYKKHVIPHLKKQLNKHIPMIICSDNHNVNTYALKQNLWIKGNPTFEGLKQIIYEPVQRVKIQSDKPDSKEDRLVIDSIRFLSTTAKFNPTPIYLNENLNVIIGGKSSGKSMLLYHIAKTLLADKDLYSRDKSENKYDFIQADKNFNFEVKTKGGFTQLLHRNSEDKSILPEIKYIPQNYLVKLAEPDENKKGNALNKIVRDLINEDDESKSIYDAFISKVKSNDRKREAIIDNYFEIEARLHQLEANLNSKPDAEILKQNIQANLDKVEHLNKSIGMSEEDLKKYQFLQNQSENLQLAKSRFNHDFKKINDFNSEVLNEFEGLRSKKALLSISLESEDLRQHFNETYKIIDDALSMFDSMAHQLEIERNDTTTKFREHGPISIEFSNIDNEQKRIQNELSPFIKNDEIKAQVAELLKSVGNDKESLQAIDQLKKEITENKKALDQEKTNLFDLYKGNQKVYIDVINELKNRTLDLEKDKLKISGIAAFNYPKFCKAVHDFSDGRSASYEGISICNSNNDPLAQTPIDQIITDLKVMFEAIVERRSYALVGKTSGRNAIKILFDDYFFDYWQIEYKGDKLGKMSTGKASFVILMLIIGLSKSKAPILIDQPEDNLDNRSITSDLIEYLKNKKVDRQIILVTHNANVVVNADAENVIVAHQKGQGDIETNSPYQFDFINGPLEDTFHKNENENNLLKSMGIREHVADIVEGGKTAFQKREEKYGFTKRA